MSTRPVSGRAVAAGGGGWLAAGAVLVAAGILTGALLSGVLSLPWQGHGFLGMLPQSRPGSSSPAHPVSQPAEPPAARPLFLAPPPLPPAIGKGHHRHQAVPSHRHGRQPSCQAKECKTAPQPHPAPQPTLPGPRPLPSPPPPVPVPSPPVLPSPFPSLPLPPLPSLPLPAPSLPVLR